VGPRDRRPVRTDYAWRSLETNQFGVDEFMRWGRALGADPMMAVNLGTLGADAAAQLVEYCNLRGGTYWSDQRKAIGHAEPYGVKLWGLGNEMDGVWQAGHVPAEVYAQRANAAGIMMKGIDPSIQTVACGSSGNFMKTYMQWDRTVLEDCWDTVDYISAHRYSRNDGQDSAWFLAEGVEIDRVLQDYAALLGYVRAVKKSKRQVYVSFDEWNVWYKDRGGDGRWGLAPHLLEEIYNLEDALVCAQYLSAFLRRADIVKIACIAQIVNVIAPVLTSKDGVLIQATYWPFVLYSRYVNGVSLTPIVRSDLYHAGERGELPAVDAAACFDESSRSLSVFLVNRHQGEAATVEVDVAGFSVAKVVGIETIGGGDVKAANSWQQPDVVVPVTGKGSVVDGKLRVSVPAPGLAVVRVELARA
jgi:alpha-N-arabinofuranosidase